MANLTLIAKVYIDSEGNDPEDVAREFEEGLTTAVEGFPGGQVVGSVVESIRPASEGETRDHFEE